MAKAFKIYLALAVLVYICYNVSIAILLCFGLLAAFFLSEKWYGKEEYDKVLPQPVSSRCQYLIVITNAQVVA